MAQAVLEPAMPRSFEHFLVLRLGAAVEYSPENHLVDEEIVNVLRSVATCIFATAIAVDKDPFDSIDSIEGVLALVMDAVHTAVLARVTAVACEDQLIVPMDIVHTALAILQMAGLIQAARLVKADIVHTALVSDAQTLLVTATVQVTG